MNITGDYGIAEIFYSIQGEGVQTGVPMVFLRLAGCNLKCEFCDTDHKANFFMPIHVIIDYIKQNFPNATSVCITGGEPTIQDIIPLIESLEEVGYEVALETNGFGLQSRFLRLHKTWVTLSPKSEKDLNAIPFNHLCIVNEIKLLVDGDKPLLLDLDATLDLPLTICLQPVWYDDQAKRKEDGVFTVNGVAIKTNKANLNRAVELVKLYPHTRLSIQTQKYINVP